MGTTFHICSVSPLEALEIDDILWALLAASESPESTDLQIHFKSSLPGNFPSINGIIHELGGHGFTPISGSVKKISEKTGWIRIALFEPEALTGLTPEELLHQTPHS